MLSLVLLLAPHVAPMPAVRPFDVVVADGHALITLPTPRDMHWPMSGLPKDPLPGRIALEQAARPRLEGAGVSLDWLQRGSGDWPTVEFIGRAKGPLPARLTLRYQAAGPFGNETRSVDVLLTGVKARKGNGTTLRDLSHHAALQLARAREAMSGGLGYYAVARKELARAWGLRDPGPAVMGEAPKRTGLVELTTGAASLDDAMALGQIAATDHAPSNRKVPLNWLPLIRMTDHPWKDMVGDKKPAPEPLAACVPCDQWFLTVTRLETLSEIADMVEAWGSPLRLVQVNDRDHRVMERYQTQLCLPIKELAKAVPAKLVRAVALTGSDLFWVEGTDVTVIVDTPSPKKLLKAIDGPLARARKLPGFKRRIHAHRGTGIEGFTTPSRKVSLYRATLDKRVVLSNSLDAMKRVLDTINNNRPSLRLCYDYRYMRTAFRRDSKEDGFVYLSDDFIRTLISPELRIKAMRRASSRAAMTQVSNAALVYAALKGKLPANRADLERAGLLKRGQACDSRGEPVEWKDGEAVSPTHGTLSGGAALIEYSAKVVTAAESDAYDQFRKSYSEKWRQFIDPIGIQFRLDNKALRVEAYMLPLTNNEAYRQLRRATGGSHSSWDPSPLAPRLAGQLRFATYQGMAIQLDDSPELPAWASYLSTRLLYPERSGRKKGQLPPLLAARHNVREPSATGLGVLGVFLEAVLSPDSVAIDRDKFGSGSSEVEGWIPPALLTLLRETAPPSAYYERIGQGQYLMLDRKSARERIARRKKGTSEEGSDVAVGLFLSRKRRGMSDAIELLLEARVREKAHAANVMWQALYDAGVVTPKMSEAERRHVALQLWGFVPSAPDGSRAVWDKATQQVSNVRHGTWHRPASHTALGPKSPLAKFLHRFESLNADLRFRRDGVHTVITFRRTK
jgi:hypothetical protein